MTKHETLWTALVAAQTEFEPIIKSASGQRSKYAPLDVVLDVIRPALNKHGIVIAQQPCIEGDTLVIRTAFVHAPTGEMTECHYPAGPLSLKHQELGAGVTYARRYSLLSLAGVFPANEDDDGEKATGAAGGERARNPETGREINPNSSAQLKKGKAWESFEDNLRGYEEARDLDGLKAWYGSEEVTAKIAKWPLPWQEQAKQLFEATHDRIEKALAAAEMRR